MLLLVTVVLLEWSLISSDGGRCVVVGYCSVAGDCRVGAGGYDGKGLSGNNECVNNGMLV